MVKYDLSKADGAGERSAPKNIYANPIEPSVCPFFSLGVYFSLHDYVLSQRETLFLREGGKGIAANKYCGEISKIFKKNKATVMSFIREGHDKVHGMNSHSFNVFI